MGQSDTNETLLRVKGTSPPGDLAAALSHALYDGKSVTLRCIGAAAVNQAVKGIAIAGGYVAQRGLTILCRPGFTTVEGTNSSTGAKESVSAIVFRVFTRAD